MDPAEVGRCWSATIDEISSETGIERWRIEEAFAYGGCAPLAIAVAEHRGLPISVVGTDGSYNHAFCVIGPGYALDILGIRSFQEIMVMHVGDDPESRIRAVTPDELREMGGSHLPFEFAEMPMQLARDGFIAGAVLDGFMLAELNCGACGDFAAVLHDMTGWPIKAEFQPSGDIEHIWVVTPEGHAVDVNGVHKDDLAVTPFSTPVTERTTWISRSEASPATARSESNRRWATALIESYPEIFGLPDIIKQTTALAP
ncbi:hypothetical protein HFN89_04305 [Rhizobium laguerreae]|nr:hypothetical protein [Rhizobium laguerreae]